MRWPREKLLGIYLQRSCIFPKFFFTEVAHNRFFCNLKKTLFLLMLRSFVSVDWMIFIFRCQGKISEKKACVANTRRWDAMNPFRNLGERYGQYEEFTGRIRNLLKDYPDGLSIPKELIQNSDDAKVRLKSVVVFIFSLEFMWERKKKEIYYWPLFSFWLFFYVARGIQRG